MKLINIKYSQANRDKRDDYFIDELRLNSLNLIVGKNATGKSRALSIIKSLARMLGEGKRIYLGDWDVTFKNIGNKSINYKTSFYEEKNIFTEELFIDGKKLMERSGTNAKMYSEKTNDWVTVNPPENRLVMHVRRDIVEFPYFEDLINWGEKTHYLDFGHIHAYSFLDSSQEEKKSSTPDMSVMFEELPEDIKKQIINDFNSLEYNINQILSIKENDKSFLIVKEDYLKYAFRQSGLSQGMYRTLHLLIFIHYLLFKNEATTVIVDDLCEGLDYKRATKLGKLIFDKLLKSNIQLIATSNDSFLMNEVNIKYWNILFREGNHIKSINYSNSKNKFDDFKFSGLSNFDLLSSDYLAD